MLIKCRECGKRIEVPDELYNKYKGRMTVCPYCRNETPGPYYRNKTPVPASKPSIVSPDFSRLEEIHKKRIKEMKTKIHKGTELKKEISTLIEKEFKVLPCSKCGEREFGLLQVSPHGTSMELTCVFCYKHLWVKSASSEFPKLTELHSEFSQLRLGFTDLDEKVNLELELEKLYPGLGELEDLGCALEEDELEKEEYVHRRDELLSKLPQEVLKLHSEIENTSFRYPGISIKATNVSLNSKSRERIPESVRSEVWNRDGGQCVKCRSNENLEFDHIIPVSKGGANTTRNIQLLCEKCNREKSASI